ncbi:MAG TPA: outer membrane protein assembly factor BamC [Caldimonas sp.]|nr:outer membrane protein assembly factor BamC [Caldimonas sp.]
MTLSLSFRLATLVSCVALLAACSTINDTLAGDKVDYKSTSSTRTAPLEVPPDLSQLTRESRYQQPNGAVSASAFQTATAAAAAASGPAPTPVIAPQEVGAIRMERSGNERWLSTTLTPEAIYPQLRTFWKDNGFNIVQDRPDAGVLETDWAENRAKLPQDFIRSAIGRVLDSAYSTGELDKFTTRVERTATGSDVFISHRGLVEVYVGQRNDSTVWQPRPSDPELEAAFLARIMVKLGVKEEQARTTVAAAVAAPSGPARARLLEGQPTPTLQLDDPFDRAWRRVGIALDRSGFTVEDRDRAQGLYFVRYVDPASAGREEPNFFSRMFSKKKTDNSALAKYRVKVNTEGKATTVAVLDSQGKPETGDAGKRIVNLLLEDLR